jgi:hypothetical protein
MCKVEIRAIEWAHGVADRASASHLGDPDSNLDKSKFFSDGCLAKTQTILHSMHRCQNRVRRLTRSQMMVWSWIHKEKPIVLDKTTAIRYAWEVRVCCLGAVHHRGQPGGECERQNSWYEVCIHKYCLDTPFLRTPDKNERIAQQSSSSK